jgi:TIR domain
MRKDQGAGAGMKGFISYSHDDSRMVREFMRCLQPAGPPRRHAFWIDEKGLTAGRVWDDAIKTAIAESDVFILLGSNAFTGSDYIHSVELPAILTRAMDCHGLIIPVYLRVASHFDGCFRILHGLPRRNGRILPIDQWSPHNGGHGSAASAVCATADKHHAGKVDETRKQVYADILDKLTNPAGAVP